MIYTIPIEKRFNKVKLQLFLFTSRDSILHSIEGVSVISKGIHTIFIKLNIIMYDVVVFPIGQ